MKIETEIRTVGLVEIGRALTRGVLVECGKWFWLGFVALVIIVNVVRFAGYGWDPTDDRAAGERSGLRLRTDHGTGCQYLETGEGSLTPRMNRAGKQVCG